MVIIASGVPGRLNRIAGTAPPRVAPFMIPMRKPKTGSSASGVKPKIEIRIGREIAMAMGPARPGVAPTAMPASTPRNSITGAAGIASPKSENSSGPSNTARMPSQM